MASVQGTAAIPVLVRVFGGLVAVLLVVAAVWAGVTAFSIAGHQRAEGTVVDLAPSGSRSFIPVVEFVPAAGAPVQFSGGIASNPPAYDIDERVPVLYPPDRPSDALIDGFWQVWFWPALIALIAVPFAIATIVLFFVVLALKRRR